MKKILGAGCALVLLVVLVLAGAFAYFVSRLDTPELKQSLLEQAKATLGTELRVKEMKISLFEGVTLKAIAVKNPAPFPGQLLTADAFVLRYRLLPLLAGRMEVERLALEKPALALAMDTKGTFNYE
jgi:AsmA protein